MHPPCHAAGHADAANQQLTAGCGFPQRPHRHQPGRSASAKARLLP